MASQSEWHMTLGAQVETGGVRFRVWAPKRARVDVVLEEGGRSFPLMKRRGGVLFRPRPDRNRRHGSIATGWIMVTPT